MIPERRTRADVFAPGAYPVSAARLTLEQDVPAHGHDFCELAVVVDGAVGHRTRHGARELVAGDVVAVRPGAWHEYRVSTRVEVVNVYVGPELLAADLDWVLDYRALTELLLGTGEAELRLDPDGLGRVVGWLDQLAERARRTGALGPVQLRGLLGCVLAECAAARHPGEDEGVLARDVRAVVRAMAADPARAWTVGELAGIAAVSVSHLHHRFADQLGMSPLRWLTRHRAEQMALRLVGTDDPVSRVGAAVGWPDPNYAARRFRAEFALSPTAYRARFTVTAR